MPPKGDMKISPWIHESNLIEDVDDIKEDQRSQLAWKWLIKQEALTVPIILGLHKRIMRVKLGMEAGRFRTCRVQVGDREGADWKVIPGRIKYWVSKWAVPPGWHLQTRAQWAKLAHIDFEVAHPFVDGNGRTGRMILNWQRVKAGLEPLTIEAKDRWEYYKWFA